MRFFAIGLVLAIGTNITADDTVFSGPQVGEPLPPFQARGVMGDDASKDLDFVKAAHGKPIVLVFVHDVNRQSISMCRILTSYSASRAKDGLSTGVVFLNDDATEAENMVKRIQHALTANVPTGISKDGAEGPGTYGLNRKVMMTILVGNQDKVAANFALIQPSLQVDLTKIVDAIVKEVGGKTPSLEDLLGTDPSMRETARRADPPPQDIPEVRSLVRPLIQKNASDAEVDSAAEAIEKKMAEEPEVRKEIFRIATTIVGSGKIENYGNERAQDYLRRWAKQAKKERGETENSKRDQPKQ